MDATFPALAFPEALKRLQEMPAFLRQALHGATRADLEQRTSPDTFCLIEHACHLRDLEREGYLVRLRRIMSESEPVLAGFEGDVIARQRDYMKQDAIAAANDFAMARAGFLALARTVSEADMRRTGRFMGRIVTVCDLLGMMVEHDLGHCREIAALVAAREAR